MEANVIIVGGGPAGVITALTAKSVYPEKSVCVIKETGDGVIPCAIPYMIHTLSDPKQNAAGNMPLENAGIDIKVEKVVSLDAKAHTVTLETGELLSYEKLVLATGTEMVMPPIPGGDKQGVYTIQKSMSAMTALREKVHAAKNVVIIGGGFIGVEFADELSRVSDVTIHLIEIMPKLLLTAFDDEYDGVTFDFVQWDDEEEDNPRYETFGTTTDCDSLYEFTAEFNRSIPKPTGFSLGTQAGHPKLEWNEVEGDSIIGYYIQRNYNYGGWSQVENITNPATESWIDTYIRYNPGGDPVSYKMQTYGSYDGDALTSDFTVPLATKGWEPEAKPDQQLELTIAPEFALKQNTPNPFNPTTNIEYSLPEESHVTMILYNMLGREIITLVDEEKYQGSYSVIWNALDTNGSQLPGGIYVYRIHATPVSGENKPFIASGKMLLMK